MARTDTLAHYLTDVADAIRAKAGTTGTIQASAFDTAIAAIPSGGGGLSLPQSKKDVNFYDYDGSLLYAYSSTDFLALTELPDNPTHTGLTAQGWNWTLTDAKEFVTDNGWCDIGQLYVTDDGKTRIYIHVIGETKDLYISLYNTTASASVVIDWGDGNTQTQSLQVNSTTSDYSNNIHHEYTNEGDYVITLSSTTRIGFKTGGYGSVSFINNGTINNSTQDANRTHNLIIKRIEIGNNFLASDYCFSGSKTMEYITLSNNIINSTSDSSLYSVYRWFTYCENLKSIIVPPADSISGIGSFMRGIRKVVFPYMTSFSWSQPFFCWEAIDDLNISVKKSSISSSTQPTQVFYQCRYLQSFKLPAGLTKIGSNFFYYCEHLYEIVFPSSVNYVGDAIIDSNNSTQIIRFLGNVTSFQSNAFQGTNSLRVLDLRYCTSVPILNTAIYHANSFKIVVPDSLVNTWKAASNWSTYSSYIVSLSNYLS